MIEIAALIFPTARERRETRGKQIRPDYPFANPLLEKLLVVPPRNPVRSRKWLNQASSLFSRGNPWTTLPGMEIGEAILDTQGGIP